MKFFVKNKKGFTLIEMMVSIFIFALMMTAVAGIFAKHISAYKKTRIMANDLENAQFALNYVAKTLRTASVIGEGTSSGSGGQKLIDINQGDYQDDFWVADIGEGLILYDFSQEACIILTFRSGPHEGYQYPALWMETQTGVVGIENIDDCLYATNWDRNNLGNICNTTDCQYRQERLTTGSVTGKIKAAPTRYQDHIGSRTTDTMGRVSITMEVVPSEFADNDGVASVNIQSSVALRDYPSDLSF